MKSIRTLPAQSGADRIAGDVAAALDRQAGAVAPGDGAVLERVRQNVLSQIAKESQGRVHTTVRAGEQPWEQVSEGVERKLLFETADSVSSLLRLAPGAAVPGHAHLIDEECLVLEGTLRIGVDLLLRAGDFHVGLKGVPHAQASTETGVIVFLREGRQQAQGASA
ncbi:MAG: cupin domain-containing protein [Ramlibacter sp.]